jgi:hypothetical protein
MERSPGQREDERTAPIRYRTEIYAKRAGDEEVQLDRGVRGSSIRELAEDLVAQASELEAQAREKLDRTETRDLHVGHTDR